MSMETLAAREAVVRAALRVLTAEHTDPHTYADAESEHADEQLALAARELAAATDQLPPHERPVGWDRSSESPPQCGMSSPHGPHPYTRLVPGMTVTTTSRCPGRVDASDF